MASQDTTIQGSEPEAPLDPRLGMLLAERYKVIARAGDGGMGVVYRGQHIALHRRVGIKVLHPELNAMPEVVERFEREARAAAVLEHPNVVAVTDFGRTPDGMLLLVIVTMKILSADRIKAWDAYTIREEAIASIELMERASRAFVNWFIERYDATQKVGIVCGTGNNGGDGLAIARLLHDWNYPVKVWIVRGGIKESPDFTANLKRLEKISTQEITINVDCELFSDRTLLIDAIFGTGLSRPVEGIYAKVTDCLNNSKAIKLAVDTPSGFRVDQHSEGEIFKAHHTVLFSKPKAWLLGT